MLEGVDDLVGVFYVARDGGDEWLEFIVNVSGGDGEEAAALTDDGAEGDWELVLVYFGASVELWCAEVGVEKVSSEVFGFLFR